MIPRAHITAWRGTAPWATDAQVEQDLVISRALVDLYSNDLLAQELTFRGKTELLTYETEELLATKVRALYQRKKGRDLFDLSEALSAMPDLDTQAIVDCFLRYMEHDGLRITRTQFESNLAEKIDNDVFVRDVPPLLASGISYDPRRALELVQRDLISKLPEGAARSRRPAVP